MSWYKMKKMYKKIFKKIKKYNNITIARHIGADPDALSSQFALRDVIKNTFPDKKVYAVGSPASRFKFIGVLDKLEEELSDALLIVLDTPDTKRIDGVDIKKYKEIIKIDHHPFVEEYAEIEMLDDKASSTCQMILEFIFANKLKLTTSIAENLYTGIVADTERFWHDYTTEKTFKLVYELISKTKINFISLYEPLYARPLNEVRFQGFIYQNINITENNVAYIKIKEDDLKEYGVDSASAGNMINDLKYVNEIVVWVFFSEDIKNNLIRANIRSTGPAINEIATRYGGGGHKFASGARLTSWEQTEDFIKDLDELVKKYKIERV